MKQVKLTRQGGVMKIDIDGALYDPLSFKSFRPTARNISDFAKAGVKLFSILTSGMLNMLKIPYSLYGESWIGEERYDFDVIDRQIDLFRENAPDCYFALMIQLDTRPWYLAAHPGTANTFTDLSQTVADEEWLAAADAYLEAVVRHVEMRYGSRFYGYFLLCGYTTEWMSQFDGEGVSESKKEAFEKLHGSAHIPTGEELNPDPCEVFIPEENRADVVRYRDFHADAIADAILRFAATVKRATERRKLVGVYFGYLFELMGARLWDAGHLGYEKVFLSEDIDMISSPSSYAHRGAGDPSAFMVTYDTLDWHDKLYYLEFDHITHLSPAKVGDITIPGGESRLHTQTETLNVMERDFLLCVTKGAALWWFDMFEGWFYGEDMMSAVGRMVKLQKKLSTLKMKSAAEILVVASGESLYAVNKNCGINDSLLSAQRGDLARMGAPYDVISLCDLPAVDPRAYKLIVFLDLFEKSEVVSDFAARAKKAGTSLLWYYAPGYLGGGEEEMQALTDMEIRVCDGAVRPSFRVEDAKARTACERDGEPTLFCKKVGRRYSFYTPTWRLSDRELRVAAMQAGVKLYSVDGTPVYVNDTLIGAYVLQDTVLKVPDGTYIDLLHGGTYRAENGLLLVMAKRRACHLFVLKEKAPKRNSPTKKPKECKE